jgi:hypothetical protein
MRDQFTDNGGTTVRVQTQNGAVRLRAEADDGCDAIGASFAPAQARELAGALLRAADEADEVAPVGALDRLVVMLEAAHDADEFADDPSLVNEIRGDAESVVRLVRDEVATFIRANIDMQGLDFPDAESVAVWLEENR